jgi:RNA polymerase sigma-70 factor, ECF subfamily
MKAWLSRAVANTVVRGAEPRNEIARWSRWFPAEPAVDDSAFQDADEEFPRHWREFPRPWPDADPADDTVRRGLADAMAELPPSWRDVVHRRDVVGRDAVDVARELGITVEQEQAMLNRARAFLRTRLAELLAGPGAA